MKVIDADGLILGRLSTKAAKLLLDGEDVIILNAEKAVVTGGKKHIMNKYRKMRELTHTRRGPFFPRQPHRILKRTVRGMLPYQSSHGRTAYKRLKVHIGVPKEMKGRKTIKMEGASSEGKTRFVTLGEVSKELGARF